MRKSICIILLFLFTATLLRADWPVGKRRTTLLPGYSFFYSDANYDRKWNRTKFPKGNSFVTHIYNFSLQHGIGRSTDIFMNIPYLAQRSLNKDSLRTAAGVGDLTIGIAQHFSSKDQHRHFTAKASFMIPMYQKDSITSLGYASRAFGLEVNYSFSASAKAFAIVQAAYTQFLDELEGPQQYTYTGTYGRKLNTFSMMTFSFMHQISYSADKSFNPNLSANKSFINGRFSLSYGRRITRTIMPMVSISTVLYGKNAGGGFGAGISLITRLP